MQRRWPKLMVQTIRAGIEPVKQDIVVLRRQLESIRARQQPPQFSGDRAVAEITKHVAAAYALRLSETLQAVEQHIENSEPAGASRHTVQARSSISPTAAVH
jgi:hypothetical protein